MFITEKAEKLIIDALAADKAHISKIYRRKLCILEQESIATATILDNNDKEISVDLRSR